MKPFITRIDIKTLLFLNCNFKRTEYNNKSGTVHRILVPDGQKLVVLIVIMR